MRVSRYLVAIALIAALGLFASACGDDEPEPTATPVPAAATPTPTEAAMMEEEDEPVTIDLIDAFPEVLDVSKATAFFIEEVSKLSDGSVTINRVGGPEVTHSLEQFAPTRDGVYDAIATVGAYHTDHTKLGLGENVAANYTRVADNYGPRVECGLYDALEDIYAPLGIQYVGSIAGGWGARLWTNEPVRDVTDLDGVHLRAATIYQPFLHAYGATTTPLQFSEIYPALEKGVIQGLYWGGVGALNGKWDEVINYQYPDSLAGGGGVSIMFNQDAWDQLSEKQQQAVRDAIAAASVFYTEFIDGVERNEVTVLGERGIESIPWPEDLKTRWTNDHYDKIIEDFIIAPDPVLGQPLADAIRCVNDIVLPDREEVDEPVTIDLIDAFPTVLDVARSTAFFIEEVNRISNGTVTINRVGGPEVTHSLEQFAPTRDGVYDAIATVGAYHTDHTKLGLGENVAANYTRIADNHTPRVQCGMYEALENIYAPLGIQYVGSITGGWGARLWTVDPIREISDLDGVHLRAATIYQPFLHAYGATTTPLQFSEIYPALEKGVIKGLYWGGAGALAGKWNEVIKYQYPDSLAGGGGIGIMFNQESWDNMSPRQQEAVRAATKSASKFYTEYIDEVERTEVATLAEQGIESIEWSDEMKATFTNDHYDKIIEDFIIAPDPVLGQPLADAIRCVNDIILPDRQ